MPIFSIIITNYNHENYLSDSLYSVLNQTFRDFECIIIDDGSTDNSLIIINKIVNKDCRFKIITQKNQGVCKARNTGFYQATGDYIIFFDSDDILHKNYLEEAFCVLKKDSSIYLYYTNAEFVGLKKNKWELPKYNYFDLLLGKNMIYLTSVISKKDVLRIQGFNEKMTDGWEDWEFYIRLLYGIDEKRIFKNEKILFYYRIKSYSRSSMINENKDVLNRMMNTCFIHNNQIYKDWFPNFIFILAGYDYYNKFKHNFIFKIFYKIYHALYIH